MSRSNSDNLKRWVCLKCGGKITTHLPLKSAPTCSKHTGHPAMTETDKK
jgi:hypothetical protein